MHKILPLQDQVIYREMMSHPALFAHSLPKKVAIIGDENHEILLEVLKHHNITYVCHIAQQPTLHILTDKRVDVLIGEPEPWLKATASASLDILIIAKNANPDLFDHYFNLLNSDGMLIQQGGSLFEPSALKTLQTKLKLTGYSDIHFLSFPQPHFSSGWRTSAIAKKVGNIRRPREKDVFNKVFATRYYNFDIHKAALVLPEFLREELESSFE